MPIRRFYFHPPVAIARVGNSTTPMDAYSWEDPEEVHVTGETKVSPAWSLDVQADGSVAPRLPDSLVFRDGVNVRPVAPFLELWATVEDELGQTREAPVNRQLLQDNGVALDSLSFRVEAHNRKAARRSSNDALAFGTYPTVSIAAGDHREVPLEGTSPPSGQAAPMVPPGRHTPLGRFQVIRPSVNAARSPWDGDVDLTTLRVRFTRASAASQMGRKIYSR